MKNLIVSCVTILSLVSACSDPLDSTINHTSQINTEIEMIDGILSFESWDSFQNGIEELTEMSNAARVKWEKDFGFQSMMTLYETALFHEDEYAKTIESGVETSEIGHSDFVINNSEYLAFDDAGRIEAPSFWFDASTVLSKKGFVIIGRLLYQFTQDGLKSKVIDFEKDLTEIKENVLKAEFQGISYTNTDDVFLSNTEFIDKKEIENARTSFDVGCNSNDDNEDSYNDHWNRLHGTVELTLTYVQTFQMFPCGAAQCSNPSLCFFGQCEGVLTTDYLSVLEVESKATRYGIPRRVYHEITYTINGNIWTTYGPRIVQPGYATSNFRKTLYSRLNLEVPLDISSSTVKFETYKNSNFNIDSGDVYCTCTTRTSD